MGIRARHPDLQSRGHRLAERDLPRAPDRDHKRIKSIMPFMANHRIFPEALKCLLGLQRPHQRAVARSEHHAPRQGHQRRTGDEPEQDPRAQDVQRKTQRADHAEPCGQFETCQRTLETWDRSATVRIVSHKGSVEEMMWHAAAARRLDINTPFDLSATPRNAEGPAESQLQGEQGPTGAADDPIDVDKAEPPTPAPQEQRP